MKKCRATKQRRTESKEEKATTIRADKDVYKNNHRPSLRPRRLFLSSSLRFCSLLCSLALCVSLAPGLIKPGTPALILATWTLAPQPIRSQRSAFTLVSSDFTSNRRAQSRRVSALLVTSASDVLRRQETGSEWTTGRLGHRSC